MSLVNQFQITLKDFFPARHTGIIIKDGRGITTVVSNRLDRTLRAYADDNQLPLTSVVEQLRDEIHRPPIAYSLTCTKCGHTGEMLRSDGSTTNVTSFEYVRVYRNGTVVARCQQCSANQGSCSRMPARS